MYRFLFKHTLPLTIYIYTPYLLSLCITYIIVHTMHKYGSRVLSSRTYRCYVVDIIDIVSVVPIYSLSIWNCCIQRKRTQQLSSAVLSDNWRGLRTIERNIQLIPLCFLLYASWSSHCLTAPRFSNVVLTLRKPLHAFLTILQSTKSRTLPKNLYCLNWKNSLKLVQCEMPAQSLKYILLLWFSCH